VALGEVEDVEESKGKVNTRNAWSTQNGATAEPLFVAVAALQSVAVGKMEVVL